MDGPRERLRDERVSARPRRGAVSGLPEGRLRPDGRVANCAAHGFLEDFLLGLVPAFLVSCSGGKSSSAPPSRRRRRRRRAGASSHSPTHPRAASTLTRRPPRSRTRTWHSTTRARSIPRTGIPQRVRVGLGGGTTMGQPGYADPTTTAAFTWETAESDHAAKVKIGTSADLPHAGADRLHLDAAALDRHGALRTSTRCTSAA